MREKLFFICFYSRAESATERERERLCVCVTVEEFARTYIRSRSPCMGYVKAEGGSERASERERDTQRVHVRKYIQIHTDVCI